MSSEKMIALLPITSGHFGTELLLTRLTETRSHALDANRVVGVVFVDFQKAFDSVSHSTLITKLYH